MLFNTENWIHAIYQKINGKLTSTVPGGIWTRVGVSKLNAWTCTLWLFYDWANSKLVRSRVITFSVSTCDYWIIRRKSSSCKNRVFFLLYFFRFAARKRWKYGRWKESFIRKLFFAETWALVERSNHLSKVNYCVRNI